MATTNTTAPDLIQLIATMTQRSALVALIATEVHDVAHDPRVPRERRHHEINRAAHRMGVSFVPHTRMA